MTKRYATVNELWAETQAPAITRIEAERAARLLFRKFGRKTGFPRQRFDAKLRRVRQVWVTRKVGQGITRGWARLAHDVSHQIFDARYPQFRPHHPLHAALELEIASYILNSGWLSGSLRPKEKSADEKREAELRNVEVLLKSWGTKLKRAKNAIQKLERRRTRLARAIEEKGAQ